jgi:EmrB/QacA subfamily drug resistance transporter
MTAASLAPTSAKAFVLALTSIASFMVALDGQVVTTALTTIRLDLAASLEAIEWTVNGYTLSFAVLLLTGAALGDRFGRRRMFVVGLAVFMAASTACALAGSAAALIAARVVQGVGAALIMPLAMALLSTAYPRDERGKALGIFGGITGVALIAGPIVGGVVTEGVAWQWVFWINLPLGLIVIPLVLRRVPESRGPGTTVDVPGLMLVTGAALALIWGIMRGNGQGWGSTEIIAALGAGTVFTVAFLARELQAREPMVPMRFFRSATFSSVTASSFLFYGAMYGTLFILPQFFQVVQGQGPFGAGLRLLPWTATLFVFAPIAGTLVNRWGERPLVVGGLLLQAVGMAWLGMIAAPEASYADFIVPLVVAGAGVSMAIPAAQNAVLGSVAIAEVGKASGVFNTVRFLGGAFGVALMAAVFQLLGGLESPQAFGDGFAPAIGTAAALSVLAAIAGMAQAPVRRAAALKSAE